MINLLEALGWMNQFDDTHLNPNSRLWLKDISRFGVDEQETRIRLAEILESSQSAPDGLDYPEALLNIGAIEWLKGWVGEVKKHFSEAYTLYPPGSHRRAVAAWLLGMIEWKFNENDEAHFHWKEAHRNITKLRSDNDLLLDKIKRVTYADEGKRLSIQQEYREKSDWYQKMLFAMSRDLSTRVEEIYDWYKLLPFELSDTTREMRELFQQKLERNLYASANSLLQEFQKSAIKLSEPDETPKIMVECSLFAFKTGNLGIAAELAEQAVTSFGPETHFRLVARWMGGAIHWRIPFKQEKGRMSWQRCIEEIDILTQKAIFDDKPERVEWYRGKKDEMKAALSEKIRESYSERDEFYPGNTFSSV